MKLTKRTAAVGAALAVVAGGAVGGALAATGTFDPKAERQAFLDDAAGRLGVTSAKLEAALKGAAVARVDAALAAGRITKDEAQAMKDAINSGKLPLGGPGPGFGPGFGHHQLHGGIGHDLDAAASYLGLTEAQLRTELEAGKSLADIAKAHGKSVDGLKQAILSSAQTELDEAVKDGRLTKAQADQLLAGLTAQLDSIVNRTGFGPDHDGPGPGPRFGFRRHDFGGMPQGYAPADAPAPLLPAA